MVCGNVCSAGHVHPFLGESDGEGEGDVRPLTVQLGMGQDSARALARSIAALGGYRWRSDSRPLWSMETSTDLPRFSLCARAC